ncbi:MAG: hypothetical protein JNG83_07020 [Opitutaceae bacterium]|nr:hypothetical protein [Opitutaceae bacterium]
MKTMQDMDEAGATNDDCRVARKPVADAAVGHDDVAEKQYYAAPRAVRRQRLVQTRRCHNYGGTDDTRMGRFSVAANSTNSLADGVCRRTNATELPVRLIAEQTAWVLDSQPHDVPVLVAARLLQSPGIPQPNSVKYFAAVDVLELDGEDDQRRQPALVHEDSKQACPAAGEDRSVDGVQSAGVSTYNSAGEMLR